eukprot:Opistho-1_new@56355
MEHPQLPIHPYCCVLLVAFLLVCMPCSGSLVACPENAQWVCSNDTTGQLTIVSVGTSIEAKVIYFRHPEVVAISPTAFASASGLGSVVSFGMRDCGLTALPSGLFDKFTSLSDM